MKTVDLCPQEELLPVFVPYDDVRINPHEDLGFPSDDELPEDFCLKLQDIKDVCKSVWAHLGLGVNVDVKYAWSRSHEAHGSAARVRDPLYYEEKRIMEDIERLQAKQERGTLTPSDVEWLKDRTRRFKEAKEARGIKGPVSSAYSFSLTFSRPVFLHVPAASRLQTVIHEACHLACFILYPALKVGHGEEWVRCMERCGVPPNVRSTHLVHGLHPISTCPKCGAQHRLKAKSVTLLRAGKGYLVCPQCGQRMTLDDVQVPEKRRAR